MTDKDKPQMPAAPFSLSTRELALRNATSDYRPQFSRMNVTPTHVEATNGYVAVRMKREDDNQLPFGSPFPDLAKVWPDETTVESVTEIGVDLAYLRKLADQLDEICFTTDFDDDDKSMVSRKAPDGTKVRLRFHGKDKAIEVLPIHAEAIRLDWKAILMPVRII